MKKGLLYILITAIAFTTLEPISKLISSQINPVSMTCIRFFIGGLILMPFAVAKIRKNNITLNKNDYITMVLLGTLNICVSMVLLQYAVLKAESPALIAIIFSANSVFTILFAALILKEKITPTKLCAVLLCVIGVLVGADLKSGTNLLSVGSAVLAALAFSLYTVLSKKLMTKLNGIIQTGFSFMSGSVILLIALLIMKIPVISPINQGNILHLLYLGFVVTGVGYWSYFRAMEKASAMAASLVFFIKPMLTPFAAFFINGIVPDMKVFIALILVITGSYFAVAKKEGYINQNKAVAVK